MDELLTVLQSHFAAHGGKSWYAHTEQRIATLSTIPGYLPAMPLTNVARDDFVSVVHLVLCAGAWEVNAEMLTHDGITRFTKLRGEKEVQTWLYANYPPSGLANVRSGGVMRKAASVAMRGILTLGPAADLVYGTLGAVGPLPMEARLAVEEGILFAVHEAARARMSHQRARLSGEKRGRGGDA